jgi:uncharacterized membrane protein YhaH (DUF805 family)
MSDNTPYQAPQSDVIDASNLRFDDTLFFSTGQRIGRLRWLVYGIVAQFGMMFFVGIAAAIMIPLMVSANGGGDAGMGVVGVIMMVLMYGAIFAVSIILNRRRLHDLEQSGWLTLLIFVPLVNLFFGLYLLFASGTKGENKYGLKPKPNTVVMWIVGLILPIAFVGLLAAIALPAYQDYVERAKVTQQD